MAEKKREYTPDVGSIEAPQYPGLEDYFVNPVQKLSKNPVGQFIAPTALAEYLHKLNYGDPISAGDRGLAALDTTLLDKPAALGLGALAKGLTGVAAAIPFWHASPRQFDRFSLSEVGGGTGLQAYGWGGYSARDKPGAGHYFADFLENNGGLQFYNPKLADTPLKPYGPKYIAKITDEFDKSIRYMPTPIDPNYAAAIHRLDESVIEYAQRHGKISPLGGYNRALKGYERQINNYEAYLDDAYKRNGVYPQDILEKLYRIKSQKAALVDFKKTGGQTIASNPPSFYRGEYTWADPAKEAATPLRRADLMNYEAPLNKQPKVAKVLINAAKKGELGESTLLGDYIRRTGEGIEADSMTGGRFYQGLQRHVEGYPKLVNLSKAPKDEARQVSQELDRIGIPGLLLPRGTRNENYVMFNDQGINLLQRDNVKLNEKAAKRRRTDENKPDTLPNDYRKGGRVRMI